MDVTPRELRDIDIREGFRGYNRDDVDELLERAAATIDSLNERLRKLSEQVQTTDTGQQPTRETEDMLHRTLLLPRPSSRPARSSTRPRPSPGPSWPRPSPAPAARSTASAGGSRAR